LFSALIIICTLITMAYLARKYLLFDGAKFHLTWRAHNKDYLLRTDFSKQLYYNLLLRHKDKHNIKIFSFCIMNNHVHLVGECTKKDDVSNYMRIVNSIFSRTMNKRLKRCGQFIMDRFKSPTIQSYNILFKVMQYVDLNPFRAKIVKHPKNYRWSSFAYYAYGKSDPLITPSPSYLSLSNNDFDRQKIWFFRV